MVEAIAKIAVLDPLIRQITLKGRRTPWLRERGEVRIRPGAEDSKQP